MEHFYDKFSFILGFMIVTLMFNMIFGAAFTEYFLLLVLLSMIVLNADKFSSIFDGLGGKTE